MVTTKFSNVQGDLSGGMSSAVMALFPAQYCMDGRCSLVEFFRMDGKGEEGQFKRCEPNLALILLNTLSRFLSSYWRRAGDLSC